MEKGFVMSDSVSLASKYGAFFRALCREGFYDEITADSSQAFALTIAAFSREADHRSPFTSFELTGGDDE